MRRRGNANTWLLGILIAIIGAIGIDVGRRMYSPPKPDDPQKQKVSHQPSFKVGDTAPDFTLPDDHGKKHALSELIKGDTILTFTCGCSSCRDMHTYIAKLLAKMGKNAPPVVTVTSMPPEGEGAWLRDTKLKQTFLFQPHEGVPQEEAAYKDMMAQLKGKDVQTLIDLYKGHPCPRVYRMDSGLKVKYIGPSAADSSVPPFANTQMAYDFAREMNFAIPGQKPGGKPVAPLFVSDNTPAGTTVRIPVPESTKPAPTPGMTAHANH